MQTKRGRPPKNKQSEPSDLHTVLALLPGRYLVRHLIDRELSTIREQIRSGQRRELIGLMPGLELERDRITEALGNLGITMNGASHAEEEPAEEEQAPRMLPASHTIDTKDIKAESRRGTYPFLWAILHWVRAHDGAVYLPDFYKRWKGTYSASKPERMTQGLRRVRDAYGVEFETTGKPYTYRLVTDVTGELPPLPEGIDKPVRSKPVVKKARAASPQRGGLKGVSKLTLDGRSLHENLSDALRKEKQVDLNELHTRLLKPDAHPNSLNAHLPTLRKRGWVLENPAPRIFKLIKEGA